MNAYAYLAEGNYILQSMMDGEQMEFYRYADRVSDDDILKAISELTWAQGKGFEFVTNTRRKKGDCENLETIEKYIMADFSYYPVGQYYVPSRLCGDTLYLLNSKENIYGLNYTITVKPLRLRTFDREKLINPASTQNVKKIKIPIRCKSGYTYWKI